MLVENGNGGGKGGSDGGGGGGNGSGKTSVNTSVNSSPGGGHNNAISSMDHLKYTPPHVLIRSISSLSQHSIRPHTPEMQDEEGMVSVAAIRKGVLLQARDRLFSRWKERYFVLTRDYLSCFRRGTTKYSEMGPFIFKVNLASVEQVEWTDRRGGPALALSLPREGRVLLRAKSGLDQWYRSLLEATQASRQRRNALRRGTSTTHLNFNNNCDGSPQFKGSGLEFSLSDSTPEIARLCDVSSDTSPCSRINNRHHRFSLLSDMDIGSVDTDMGTPPSSVTSSNKFSTSTSTSTNSGSGGSSSLASSPSLRGSGGGWPLNVSPHRQGDNQRNGRPASPMRTPTSAPGLSDNPRSRLSLYEGSQIPTTAKSRHSLCVEPRDRAAADELAARKQKNRHSICVEPRELVRTREQSSAIGGGLGRSRASLCLEPRNPLLDLMESVEALPTLTPPPPPPTHGCGASPRHTPSSTSTSASPRASPVKSSDLPGRRSSNPGVPVPVHLGGTQVVSTSPSPGTTPHRPRAHSTSLTPERTLGPRSRSNLGFFRHSGLFNH